MSSSWQQRMAETLSKQPEGASIAVVTLLGSLCPITSGHILAFVEARKLCLGADGVRRPARLERFDEAIGFISLNGDRSVDAKLNRKGLDSLTQQERRALVHLAIAEIPWMGTEEKEGGSMSELRATWPHLTFTQFIMNGADDVRKYRKWTWTDQRLLTMGRPGDTEHVVHAAQRDGVDLEAGQFIMGPELPDVSSSDARLALCRGDVNRAAEMLHPDVLAWCVQHGPWRPSAKAANRTIGGAR